MNCQFRSFDVQDFQRICADLDLAESELFFKETSSSGGFFGLAKADNGNYLARVPDAGTAGSRWLNYVYSFEERIFRVRIEIFGNEAVIDGVNDVREELRN